MQLAGSAFGKQVLHLESTELRGGEADALRVEGERVWFWTRSLGLTSLAWGVGAGAGAVLGPQRKLTQTMEPRCVEDDHLRMMSKTYDESRRAHGCPSLSAIPTRWTFPVAPFGISVTNEILRGTLKAANCSPR